MTVQAWVNDVVAGKIKCKTAVVKGDAIYSMTSTLTAEDIDVLTAEAFNQDVFPEDAEWEDGLQSIRAALKRVRSAPEG